MSELSPVTWAVDTDAVGWITFDDPEAKANVLNPATREAFAASVDAVMERSPRALVLLSGKARIFIAGADLRQLAEIPDAQTATALSRAGQTLFQRVADLGIPVVAAIHGACAGGGLELALACHWRIATDAPATQIGLPETSIGTIPGWGGTVRLPRLIGVKPALDHILKGSLIDAAAALKLGLVNEIVASEILRARAKSAALKLVVSSMPPLSPPAAAVPALYHELRASVRARSGEHLPALLTVIDAVEQTARLPVTEALAVEARLFGEVTAGRTCKNLIRVFFLREAAKKRTLQGWFESESVRRPAPAPIRRVGVIGAGVMGSGIAHALATHGLTVMLCDVQPELLDRGVTVIRGLFDDSVRRGKLTAADAHAGMGRIATATGLDFFEGCDVVIEAIVENAGAKRKLFSDLGGVVKLDTLLASNTSALPIDEIAGHVPNPARTLGLHFFNPVSRMPLVELILGAQTSTETAERGLALTKALGKSPIVCRSSPGFLVTRVLFFYLNAAVRLWEQGIATVELDGALRDFGWPMGPLRLIDEVGLDVTDFIFGEMAHYFPQRFTRATACTRLLAAGLRGRKNGTSSGFYTYAGGESINDGVTRHHVGRLGDLTMSREEITDHLMRVMAEEAERCLAEGVVKSADDVDFALLSGTGFPAFRGGLLHWAAETFGRANRPR